MAAAIRVTLFGGIIPRLADRGLPDNAAQFALNAKLYSGELRSWNHLRALDESAQAPGATRKVFHYRHNTFDRYLTFATDADVVKAPLLNETLGRLYYTDPTGAYVTTTQRIEDGNPPFKLGVPSPVGTFTVVPTGGSVANAETRVYTVSLVTSFGEESAPGAVVSAAGNADGTWTINGLNALTIPAGYGNVTTLRLYRTITSATGVDYRMVNEWAIGSRPASYVDNVTAVDLADNPPLDSLGWGLPPANLLGLTGVAGGFMVGFTGRTVRACVPYYPHAWPDDYAWAVEDNIVGLATFGNTIAVLTEGRPYLLVGQTPESLMLQKMESIQPCLAKRGIANTVAGVLYPSTDGLVLIDGNANSGQIVSRNWVTKDEWLAQFTPRSTLASIYQDRYLSFYTDELGYTVGFDDPVTGWTQLQQEGVLSVDTDALTGQTLVTVIDPEGGPDRICEWDGDTTQQEVYTWRSKQFLQNKPVNFGAMQVRGSFIGNSGGIPLPPAQQLTGYSINSLAIGGGRRTTLAPVDGVPYYGGSLNGPPDWQILGISPTEGEVTGVGIAVKLYGDGILRFFSEVMDENPVRLPSGYKATMWELEVQGVSPLFSLVVADTVKALEQIP
jgi:hypothetical protein